MTSPKRGGGKPQKKAKSNKSKASPKTVSARTKEEWDLEWDRYASELDRDTPPDEAFVGAVTYVLRSPNIDGGVPLVELGPLATEDDLEEAVLDLLMEHPWEPERYVYSLLTLGVSGEPDIEPVDKEWLNSLMLEAWWEEAEEEDDDYE